MSAPAHRGRFGLGRARRLRGAREFGRVKAEGARRACGCLILNWHRPPTGNEVKLGVVTGRRLGGAVVRSRARRLLREAFRLHRHEISAPASIVLVARASLVGKSRSHVERDLCRVLTDVGLRPRTVSP